MNPPTLLNPLPLLGMTAPGNAWAEVG